MSAGAAGIVGGAISGFGSIAGSAIGASASRYAARRIASAMEIAAQAQIDMLEKARGDMAPYREAGYKAIDEMWSMDPTGGAQKYIDQLEGLEFQFDPDDEIYKWRQEQNEKAVNRFMASRGGYDSRVALNALQQSGMQLQENEISRQFQQRYLTKFNQLTKLYDMTRSQGAGQYSKLADLANLGSGHAMGSAQAAFSPT